MSSLESPPREPAAALPSRLDHLKAQSRQPGEASFFWYETHFKSEAVKVLPGEYFVDDEDIVIMTTLGSCIAACLWDRHAGIGGMNHFMLPEGDDGTGRYGSHAMELLINAMMKRGAVRSSLEAKIFGGGQIIAGMVSANVGERNARFVLDYLRSEHIPVVSKDLLGAHPRKVCFLPASGKVMVMRLAATQALALLAQERTAAHRAMRATAGGGSVELF